MRCKLTLEQRAAHKAAMWKDTKRAAIASLIVTVCCLIFPALSMAQAVNIDLGTGAGLTERVVQLVGLLTVLTLAPSIVIMTTSFVRIVVVLSLLRTALGLQQSPPNAVLVSLALFLTAIVMAPTFQTAYDQGIQPLLEQQMELPEAFGAATDPVKAFMLTQVEGEDLALFLRLSRVERPANLQDVPLQVITPAFMISELKRAFEIGFLLFVPFLVIDLVVASVLMSMGMMMLPPVVVSLPFKLIFFVLVDGWRLVAGSLVESFQRGAGGSGRPLLFSRPGGTIMSKTVLAAALSLIALPVFAQSGDDLMKMTFGNTVTVEIPGLFEAKMYYDPDHTYRMVGPEGTVKGTWKATGDKLCSTPTDPAGPETCSKLEPRKIGDKWKSPDEASGIELEIGIVEGRE